MSVESPPSVICDTYNYKNWNVDTGTAVTKTWVLYNFLSKRVSDSAQGLISFISGIKTNTVTAYSGNSVTIGETGASKTVGLYTPYLLTAIADVTDDSYKIPSTSWVQLWFGNILNNLSLSWALAQTFTLGILTNSIKCITTSGTLNINSVDSGTGGVIICGGSSQTSGVTIGNNNGITANKIDIGSQTKTLSLTGSNIDLASALRPFYSYPIGANKIGEIISATYTAAGVFQSGAGKTFGTLNLTDNGVWAISASLQIIYKTGGTINRVATFFQASTGGAQLGQAEIYNQTANSANAAISLSTNSIVYIDAETSYGLVLIVEFSGTAPELAGSANFMFRAVRIA